VTDAAGHRLHAAVPSGASTGAREARELRDGDPQRYGGRGVLGAVAAVRGPIKNLACSQPWHGLEHIDSALRDLDGTPDLSRLGANAVLGMSTAMCRVFARASSSQLYDWIDHQRAGEGSPRLPVPHFNVVNGGAHAANELAFQEFMVAPVGAPDLPSAVQAGTEIYHALRRRLAGAGHNTGLGDEGGFAPEIGDPADVLEQLTRAVDDAGYVAGRDGVMLALDPAANGFFEAGRYQVGGDSLTSTELVELYAELTQRFPIWSVEDGCAEDDREGWKLLTGRLGERIQLVADDIACTQAQIVRALASAGIGNAILVKPNQVGTISDTLETVEAAESLGYSLMVSHRSGETVDDFVADLAVGIGCGELKSGAPARGERVAKYNRLLAIAAAKPDMPYGLATPKGYDVVRNR
jgi:enolase